MIPLHPLLVEAGFIRFVEQRHNGAAKKLFRELKPNADGFWSSVITQKLNRIIRNKLSITNPRYTLYSLRHNFIDACKEARIADEVRMKIMGHQLAGVHGVYGNPRVLPHESEQIKKVSFSEIDFGNYPVGGPRQDGRLPATTDALTHSCQPSASPPSSSSGYDQ